MSFTSKDINNNSAGKTTYLILPNIRSINRCCWSSTLDSTYKTTVIDKYNHSNKNNAGIKTVVTGVKPPGEKLG